MGKKLLTAGEDPHSYLFWCPGCRLFHGIRDKESKKDGRAQWTFNGDLEKPTFNPSHLTWWEHGEKREKRRCHSYIRDGMIQFLSDCTHELAGKTVPLPDIPE